MAGRTPHDVGLVAVSKFHSVAAIGALARLTGQTAFGESYAQEALEKQTALSSLPLSWHFVGHVQSRKARDVAGHFCLVHSVDSVKLARKLQGAMCSLKEAGHADAGARQGVLIQVNIGQEPQKSGVFEGDTLLRLADELMQMDTLRFAGLMCMPPAGCPGEAARPYFVRLRQIKEALELRLDTPLPHLSMGMSHDFEQAVAEGATLIRVGTDIFGERPPCAVRET